MDDDEGTAVVLPQRGVVQTISDPRAQADYMDLIREANHNYERLGAIRDLFESPKKLERASKSHMSQEYQDYHKELAEIYKMEKDLKDLDYWIEKKSKLLVSEPFVKTKLQHTNIQVYVPKTAQASSQPQTMQAYNKPSIQATPVQTTVQLSHYAMLQEAQLAYYRPMIMDALDAVIKEFITPVGSQGLAIVKRDKHPDHGSGHFYLAGPDKEKERAAIDYFWRTLRTQQLAQRADNVEIIRVMLRMEGRYAKKDLSDVTILTDTQRAIINSAINASIYHQTASYLQLAAQLKEQVEANKALQQQVVPAANPNSQLTQLQSLVNTQEAKIRALEADITRRNAADQQVALVPMSSTALVPIDQSTVNPNTTVLIQRIQSLEELVAVLRHNAQQSEKTLAFTQTVLNTSQSHVTTLTETTQNMSATMQMVAGRLSTSTRQATTGELKF